MTYGVCVSIYVYLYIDTHIYALVFISRIILRAFVGFFGWPWMWLPMVSSRAKNQKYLGFSLGFPGDLGWSRKKSPRETAAGAGSGPEGPVSPCTPRLVYNDLMPRF